MRLGSVVMGLLLGWLAAGGAAAQEPQPLDWLGKDPLLPQGERTLLQVPAIEAQLRRLTGLPAGGEALIAPYDVERQGELLLAYLCDQRSCAQRNWALLIDLETGEVGLCDYTAKVSQKAMSYTLVLTRSFLSARLALSGVLSQSMPNGCLDAGSPNLPTLWATARQVLN